MVPRLGWRWRVQPLLLSAFTVRVGTDLQTVPVEQRRRERCLVPYAALALAAAAGPVDELLALLRRLWRVRWGNARKEPFWRLVYDAHPTAARMHLDQPCCCGAAVPANHHHHSWACPVAQAVVATVTQAVAAQQPLAAPLSKPSIWLARPPPAVHGGVWGVVCLAAVAAMDHGRRRMFALSTGPARPTPVHVTASRSAVARFWALLADVVALRRVPLGWQERVPPGHPFIHFDPATSSFAVTPPPVHPLAVP